MNALTGIWINEWMNKWLNERNSTLPLLPFTPFMGDDKRGWRHISKFLAPFMTSPLAELQSEYLNTHHSSRRQKSVVLSCQCRRARLTVIHQLVHRECVCVCVWALSQSWLPCSTASSWCRSAVKCDGRDESPTLICRCTSSSPFLFIMHSIPKWLCMYPPPFLILLFTWQEAWCSSRPGWAFFVTSLGEKRREQSSSSFSVSVAASSSLT